MLRIISVELQKNENRLSTSLIHHNTLLEVLREEGEIQELSLMLFNPTDSALNLYFNDKFIVITNLHTLLILSEIRELQDQLVTQNERGSNILLQVGIRPPAEVEKTTNRIWQGYFLDLLTIENRLLEKYQEAADLLKED